MIRSTLLLASLIAPQPAWSHSADRGFVLLLPTNYYVIGGGLAVLASVLLFSMLGPAASERYQKKWFLARWPYFQVPWLSLVSTLVLATLIVIGFMGDSDPLSNPLPLVIWTLFWVMLTLWHAIGGNLWRLINPWSGVLWLMRKRLPSVGKDPLITLPAVAGYWPAIFLFALFAWFELVSLSPEDPPSLARAVFAYWLFNFIAMIMFSETVWRQRGEAFSVFFGFIALLSPVGIASSEESTKPTIQLRLPASELLRKPALPFSGALFVLVTLASVSFDGFNKTFWWLSHNGINPLAFEGRSSVMQINSLGLAMAILVLVAAYMLSVLAGWWLQQKLAKPSLDFKQPAAELQTPIYSTGLFALAILPISLGYHAAHYLTQLLVNGQYLIKAISDPFNQGWNLLGTADLMVTTSFLSHHHSVERLWQLQLACIVLGHIVSALIAHMLALRLYQSHRAAVISQLPLALLMVLYTCFGLWLLSTPTGL